MGVYIPNMEKPKDCKKCPRLCRWDDGWGNRYKCLETGEEKHWKFPNPCKPTNCPLIEIVECKDCKWFINEGSVTICDTHETYIEPTDFCSYGERRADGDI